ncbi:hypothetical protein [Saccharothrix sp. ALI-22-I]|nr:hypothetical protein [Saccharothrix sp. ALI-22-I]
MLWARLSVFPGPRDWEAALYVCAGNTPPSHQVEDAITGLADKSILD